MQEKRKFICYADYVFNITKSYVSSESKCGCHKKQLSSSAGIQIYGKPIPKLREIKKGVVGKWKRTKLEEKRKANFLILFSPRLLTKIISDFNSGKIGSFFVCKKLALDGSRFD